MNGEKSTICCVLAPEVNDGLDFHRKTGEHGQPYVPLHEDRCEATHHVYEPPQDGIANHYDLRCRKTKRHLGAHQDVFDSTWERP